MWPESWADSALARALCGILFASPCTICEADDGPFCESCRNEMTDCGTQCPRCALTVGPYADRSRGCSKCRGVAQGFDEAIALGPYQGPIRDLCLRLKSVHHAWLARWATDMLMDVHGDRLRSIQAEMLIPVPLHWRRRLKRGYNQSCEIADQLARRLKVPVRNRLRRLESTQKLAGLTKTERAQEMRDVFQAVRRHDLEGKTVILVDDVLTTGATCGACARVLKKAGAKRVVAVVLARAEGRA